jgi:hypothetical protein
MAHLLTTRARALADARQPIPAQPAQPTPPDLLHEQATAVLITGLWHLLLALLFLCLLGTVLYPKGKQTHPVRVAEETPQLIRTSLAH